MGRAGKCWVRAGLGLGNSLRAAGLSGSGPARTHHKVNPKSTFISDERPPPRPPRSLRRGGGGAALALPTNRVLPKGVATSIYFFKKNLQKFVGL